MKSKIKIFLFIFLAMPALTCPELNEEHFDKLVTANEATFGATTWNLSFGELVSEYNWDKDLIGSLRPHERPLIFTPSSIKGLYYLIPARSRIHGDSIDVTNTKFVREISYKISEDPDQVCEYEYKLTATWMGRMDLYNIYASCGKMEFFLPIKLTKKE